MELLVWIRRLVVELLCLCNQSYALFWLNKSTNESKNVYEGFKHQSYALFLLHKRTNESKNVYEDLCYICIFLSFCACENEIQFWITTLNDTKKNTKCELVHSVEWVFIVKVACRWNVYWLVVVPSYAVCLLLACVIAWWHTVTMRRWVDATISTKIRSFWNGELVNFE